MALEAANCTEITYVDGVEYQIGIELTLNNILYIYISMMHNKLFSLQVINSHHQLSHYPPIDKSTLYHLPHILT
jgi:hypothetical protein